MKSLGCEAVMSHGIMEHSGHHEQIGPRFFAGAMAKKSCRMQTAFDNMIMIHDTMAYIYS